MMYEVEFVRVDDAFDFIEVEAESPNKAVNIAIDETILFDSDGTHNFWKMLPLEIDLFHSNIDQWRNFDYDYIENWRQVYNVQYLCKKIIIRDENGEKLY